MSRPRHWWLLLVPLLIAAGSVTGLEAKHLAETAGTDPTAEQDLSAVTEIDRVPVDMTSLLATDRGSRIAVIAALDPGRALDADSIRDQAKDLLSDPRYPTARQSWLRRLFGPLLVWADRGLAYFTDLVVPFFRWLVDFFASGVGRWIAVPGLFVVTAAGAWYLGRKRAREIERRAVIERILELGVDPAELMSMADRAEAAGDHPEAIRLRFVAGLLYLDAEGVIEFAPGLSNGEIAARVGSPDFEVLARQFDDTVYGRLPAGADASATSRRLWSRLIGVRS